MLSVGRIGFSIFVVVHVTICGECFIAPRPFDPGPSPFDKITVPTYSCAFWEKKCEKCSGWDFLYKRSVKNMLLRTDLAFDMFTSI